MIGQINLNEHSIDPLLIFMDKMQENEKSYGILRFAEEMPGGFFIYRADRGEEILYANKAMLRIFECDTLEEFLTLTGGSFQGIVHPEDLDEVENSIEEQIRLSRYDLDYVEYRVVTKSGKVRWIDDYGHFIHSEKYGDIFYVFVGDATEKKTLQQQERESLQSSQRQQQLQIEEYDQELKVIHQEHLRHLEVIEGLSVDYESIFYVDLDKNKIKAYRLSGRFEREFPRGRMVRDFEGFDENYIRDWVYPDDQKALKGISTAAFIREKLSAEKTFHTNFRVWDKEKVKYMQIRMVNAGSQERISRVVMGYRNVDEEIIREMKQKQILSDALDKANQANNAKNLFLSNMSHDIRTPMNAIVGLTELARKKIGESEVLSGYLDGIRQASDQLLALLNDVLEISRIESGKVFVEEGEVNLLEIMHQVQAEQKPRAEARNIVFSLDVSGLKCADVFADQKKLLQILTYLVDNAVKYTRANGKIMLTARQREETRKDYVSYQFVVEDSGIGMDEKFLAHVFAPFEREKNTTLGGVSGAGLGLTITRHLVEMIGGTIEVVSKLGEGSCFTVTLPLRIQSKQQDDKEETEETELYFCGQKRVLIVDDNDINLEIETQILRELGFLVDTASDGSIAVEMAAQSEPGYYDLILMDIQMPIMDGYHAARAIRKMDDPVLAQIPIIAVSANNFETDRKASLESGMNEHLGKPLDVKQLCELLKKFLES